MNKTALITGATSGIGKACAIRFAQGGYDIILTGRTKEKVTKAQREILELCPNVEVFPLIFDVRDNAAATKAIASLPEDWREIDVLVNNAGLALGLDSEFEGNLDDWEIMIDTNIKGLLYMTRLVVPMMVTRRCGHIINIGSVAGDAAYANGNVYCATKAAVKALSDGLRIDLAHTPLRVTNLKPGLVETNFSTTRFHGDTQRAEKVYKGIKPLSGADIADVAFYAASAPAHVQIAEVLILPTHQASGSVIYRED
ncbi:MAG: SDR family NAD(P)-dependent oxidoreductase [Bacteroidales bacterium]|nr:SDR family NAD(P)-dependent oxidoreductase [Bacteroidales bacterium]